MFYTNINKFNNLKLLVPITLLGFLNSAAFGIDSTTDCSADSDICKSVPNLLPQNIRKGVTILGVVGTFSGETTPEPSSPSASSHCEKDNGNGTTSSPSSSFWECCRKKNPRYRDNRNGTVKDMCTGLIWLKNANCFGMLKWEEAKEKVANLASEEYWKTAEEKADELEMSHCYLMTDELEKGDRPLLTDESKKGDWRLPTKEEWEAMVEKKYHWPGPSLSNAAGTEQWAKGDVFSNVQTNLYWSGTTDTIFSSAAWCMYLGTGKENYYFKGGTYYVWPVREEKEEEKERSEF
jgi:hypothetical protein